MTLMFALLVTSGQLTVKVDWVVIGGVVIVVGFGLRLQEEGVRV